MSSRARVNMGRRRHTVIMIMITFFVVVAFCAGAVTEQSLHAARSPASPVAAADGVPVLKSVSRVPAVTTSSYVRAKQIPVLAYHALNDKCSATEVICKSRDYESVSTTQFKAEMQWLYAHKYHTVTMDQYLKWLSSKRTLLPPKPVLMVDDNGDSDFLLGAEPVLYHYRYTVTAVIVTGFANAATTGYCLPRMKVDGRSYDVQANCGGPNTWNATWGQLAALSPQVYNYALEAGPSGHYVQDYSKTCTAYYACKIPGESSAAYKNRVFRDIQSGMTELVRRLPGRVNTDAWVVPYSDLGYSCPDDGCSEDVSTGPHNWLIGWAARHYAAVFVQDTNRNGVEHERFRFEIHNTTTLAQFGSSIDGYIAEGGFRWAR